MFDISSAVIEARLERYVEQELNPDPFLGDADYAVVWRYLPVMSSQQCKFLQPTSSLRAITRITIYCSNNEPLLFSPSINAIL